MPPFERESDTTPSPRNIASVTRADAKVQNATQTTAKSPSDDDRPATIMMLPTVQTRRLDTNIAADYHSTFSSNSATKDC